MNTKRSIINGVVFSTRKMGKKSDKQFEKEIKKLDKKHEKLDKEFDKKHKVEVKAIEKDLFPWVKKPRTGSEILLPARALRFSLSARRTTCSPRVAGIA